MWLESNYHVNIIYTFKITNKNERDETVQSFLHILGFVFLELEWVSLSPHFEARTHTRHWVIEPKGNLPFDCLLYSQIFVNYWLSIALEVEIHLCVFCILLTSLTIDTFCQQQKGNFGNQVVENNLNKKGFFKIVFVTVLFFLIVSGLLFVVAKLRIAGCVEVSTPGEGMKLVGC